MDIQLYEIIYEAVESVKKALEGLLEPEQREVIDGNAEVRNVFRVPKAGIVAGCYVTSGSFTRNGKVRVLRDHVVIYDSTISSLRRFKDDVKEVASGFECGIGRRQLRRPEGRRRAGDLSRRASEPHALSPGSVIAPWSSAPSGSSSTFPPARR